MSRITTGLLITILAVAAPGEAFALIRGDAGNKPVPDPGWPTGAAAIFNHTGRIAWWEGPPFGGASGTPSATATRRRSTPSWPNFAGMDAEAKAGRRP